MEIETIELKREAEELGIRLSPEQLEKFDVYQCELLKWNAKINLVSEKSAREIKSRHFLDSLTVLPIIEDRNARVIDIGSGAGFPGLPLKIAAPSLEMYLLEKDRKKASFLKDIIRQLHLADTFVIDERVETAMEDDHWHGYFDVLVSRATFKLADLLPLGAYFLAPEVKIIALKSINIVDELLLWTIQAPKYNFSQLYHHNMKLKILPVPRKIIVAIKSK